MFHQDAFCEIKHDNKLSPFFALNLKKNVILDNSSFENLNASVAYNNWRGSTHEYGQGRPMPEAFEKNAKLKSMPTFL